MIESASESLNPSELLENFLQEGRSERTFATLMSRLGGLVYGSALRRTQSVELAEEVTQNVFAILARKAAAIRKHPSLTAWLYQTTKYEAIKAMRTEQRQQRKRDALAAELATATEPASPDSGWSEAIPVIDELLDHLSEGDRDLILKRFFEEQKFREIAATSGRTEAACKMQLKRTLGKLSQLLTARGVTLSATTFASGLASELAQAAPAHLATAAPKALAASSALSNSALLTNAIQTMNTIKTASLTITAIALLATGPFLWQRSVMANLEGEILALSQSEGVITKTRVAPLASVDSPTLQQTVGRLRNAAAKPIDIETMLDELTQMMMTQDIMGLMRVLLPVSQLSPDDLAALMEDLQSHQGNNDAKNIASQMLSALTAERDPAKALDHALKIGYEAYTFSDQLFEWATRDSDAAIAWYETRLAEGALEGKGLRQSPDEALLARLLEGVAKSDIDKALALFEKTSPSHRLSASRSLATALASRGPEFDEQLRTLIQDLESPSSRDEVVQAAVSSMHTRKLEDATAFLNAYELAPISRIKSLVDLAVSQQLNGNISIAEAGEWLLAQAQEGEAAAVLAGLMHRLSFERSEELDLYTTTHENGPIKDASLAGRAMALTQLSKSSEGLKKAMQVQESHLREKTIQKVVNSWKRVSASSAIKGLQDAGLDPSQYGLSNN